MSEIYKRSLGQTYDPEALRHELDNGTAGYDTSYAETIDSDDYGLSIPAPHTVVDGLRNERMQWNMIEAINGGLTAEERDEVVLLETEIIYREYEQKMSEIVIEHPKYTWHVGQILVERLDEVKEHGHPVDAEMYIEARQLAEEIVAANPDKDAEELNQIVTTMVGMIQAEYKVRQYTLAA